MCLYSFKNKIQQTKLLYETYLDFMAPKTF